MRTAADLPRFSFIIGDVSIGLAPFPFGLPGLWVILLGIVG
jgi:hypothetical protein